MRSNNLFSEKYANSTCSHMPHILFFFSLSLPPNPSTHFFGRFENSRSFNVLENTEKERNPKPVRDRPEPAALVRSALAVCISHASELSYRSSTLIQAWTPDSNDVNNFTERRTLLTSNTIQD